jgi:cytochrome c biogenesis protein CcmG/thiol:disulfide interchange protein DsbE
MRRLIYIAPILVFAVMALFFARGLFLNPKEIPSVLIDKPAPALALPALKDGGKGLASEDIKGRVTLVNFFASWCVPCRAEHALLMDVAAKGEVPVIGVNYKDKTEDAVAWLARLGDPYERIGADRDGRAAIDWGVYGVPESYVIDKHGNIRYKQIGPLTRQDLDNTVLPLIRALAVEPAR